LAEAIAEFDIGSEHAYIECATKCWLRSRLDELGNRHRPVVAGWSTIHSPI
jgi:hypothetical protein